MIVLWGDGSAAETLSSVNPLTRSFSGGHTYSNSGVYTISVSVVDSDGAVSVKQDKTAVVGGIGVLNGTLYVIGTNGKDEVDIKLKSNGNAGQVVGPERLIRCVVPEAQGRKPTFSIRRCKQTR